MIDTLRLKLNEKTEFCQSPNLTVFDSTNLRTGERVEKLLWRVPGGGEQAGAKAVHNGLVSVTVDGRGTVVEGSFPRVQNGYNLNPIESPGKFQESIQKVENYLEETVGIKTKLMDSVIVRADIFRNAITDSSPKIYMPLLSRLDLGKRMQQTQYGGETVEFKNGERRVTCYDKIQEMRDKFRKSKTSFDFSTVPENVLRAELKFWNKKSVERHVGISTLQELYQDFEGLEKFYKKHTKDLVFCFRPSLPSTQDLEKRMRGYGKYQTFLKYEGLRRIAEEGYKVEEVTRLVSEVFGRYTARRARVDFQNAQLSLGENEGEGKTSADLYQELYQKLVA